MKNKDKIFGYYEQEALVIITDGVLPELEVEFEQVGKGINEERDSSSHGQAFVRKNVHPAVPGAPILTKQYDEVGSSNVLIVTAVIALICLVFIATNFILRIVF